MGSYLSVLAHKSISSPASLTCHLMQPPLPNAFHSWKWSKPYCVEMARSLMVAGPDGVKTRVGGGGGCVFTDCAWVCWCRLGVGG